MVKKDKVGSTFGGEMTAISERVSVMMQGKVVGAVGVGGSLDVAQDGLIHTEDPLMCVAFSNFKPHLFNQMADPC